MKRKIKEGQMSHHETINNLTDQMKKFILKNKDNPNSIVNDVSISIFLAFSEAFSKDGDPNTTGLKMLDKMISQLRILAKEYEDLEPEEGEDFNLEDDDIDDMKTTLDDDEDEDSDEPEDLEDEPDNEDKELDNNDTEEEDED
jgi:hypothetical protein